MNNEERLSLIISEQIHREVANELVPYLMDKELNEDWQNIVKYYQNYLDK